MHGAACLRTFISSELRPDLATARLETGVEVHAAGAMKASVEAAATSANARDLSIFVCCRNAASRTHITSLRSVLDTDVPTGGGPDTRCPPQHYLVAEDAYHQMPLFRHSLQLQEATRVLDARGPACEGCST